MPWNSQGGGGWQGGGGPGPWGGRPGGGQQPPDLEELLRRSQEKVKSLFPGGGSAGVGPQGPACWSGLAILGLWLASGIYHDPAGRAGPGHALRQAQPRPPRRA